MRQVPTRGAECSSGAGRDSLRRLNVILESEGEGPGRGRTSTPTPPQGSCKKEQAKGRVPRRGAPQPQASQQVGARVCPPGSYERLHAEVTSPSFLSVRSLGHCFLSIPNKTQFIIILNTDLYILKKGPSAWRTAGLWDD